MPERQAATRRFQVFLLTAEAVVAVAFQTAQARQGRAGEAKPLLLQVAVLATMVGLAHQQAEAAPPNLLPDQMRAVVAAGSTQVAQPQPAATVGVPPCSLGTAANPLSLQAALLGPTEMLVQASSIFTALAAAVAVGRTPQSAAMAGLAQTTVAAAVEVALPAMATIPALAVLAALASAS